ncbi:MAG: TetR/AcrR family transcriptional regulator [Solirubrobacteraceae bacterium]|nr:TetR/AcrR family transcriptional regulator [Solirubrobacteraceae bacterium]
MSATPSSTRPGGRSARIRADVHGAVRELLVEEAGDALTLPMIAQRAGVHPTTLYRRWGSVGELLTDVAASRISGEIEVPETGSLRGDLVRWVEQVTKDVADPDTLSVIRATIGTNLPDSGCACAADRRAQLAAILDREDQRGRPAPTVDKAADLLLGPIYYRAIFLEQPVGPEIAPELVDTLLAASKA